MNVECLPGCPDKLKNQQGILFCLICSLFFYQQDLFSQDAIGIGTSQPTAQLHTTGTVRFAGITNNNACDSFLVRDINGNLFFRHTSTLNDWHVSGNTGTGVNSFLGTADDKKLSIRTNNMERITVLANGQVGIGTTNPKAKFHIVDGDEGTMNFPYETLVVEKREDSKLGIYSTSTDPGNLKQASSVALGFTNYLDANDHYPSYEMQYGFWNNAGFILRFNALARDISGNYLSDYTYGNVLCLDTRGNVGINLTNGNPGDPAAPTANLHVNGTVRLQNLPQAVNGGNYLLIDANGNVRVSANTIMNRPSNTDNSSNIVAEMKVLRQEINTLKEKILLLENSVNK